MYVVIVAGGSGTRLWPLSRRSRPKQFQAFVSDESLLRETYDRVRRVAEPEEIFIATTAALADLCQEQLDGFPTANILVEPVGRNTGPAIGYAAAVLERLDPDAVVATVHSDHTIGFPERFAAALSLARETVEREPDRLLTIGLRPTWGNPAFGYLRAGRRVAGEELEVLPIERFEEKPSPDLAREYFESGDYYWNAGYFVFKAATMMARLGLHAPKLLAGLRRIQAALDTPRAGDVLEVEYAAFEAAPIDELVFEPESAEGRVWTVPVDLDWDDLGSWQTIRDVMLRRDGGSLAARGEVLALETRNTLVVSSAGRLVAVLGLDDVVVVDTPDALLVCRAGAAQRVKELLELLPDDDPRR